MSGTRFARAWLCAGAIACFAHPATAKTFAEALAQTYEVNPDIDAARAELRSVDEQVPQALANWRPSVQVNGSANYEGVYSHPSAAGNQTAPTTLSGAGTIPNLAQASIPGGHQALEPYSYSVQVTQPVYRGGKTAAETRRAENNVLAQRAQLQNTEQTTLLAAGTAYLDVVRDQTRVDLESSNTQLLHHIADSFAERLKIGEVSRTDVSQALAQQAQIDSSRVLAENQLAASRAAYLRYVQEIPENLTLPELPYVLPATLEEAEDEAAKDNPQVVSALYVHDAAKASIDLAEGGELPQLNLIGEAGRTREGYGGSPPTEDATVEAQLNIPLYTGGLVSSQVRQAKQTAGQRHLEVAVARQKARQQVMQAWESYQASAASIDYAQKAVAAAEDAYKGASVEENVGTKTTLDLLNAVQVLLNSQTTLAVSQHDKLVAELNLLAATGRLTAQNLALPVESYDPRDYYNHVHDRWIGNDIDMPTSADAK